MEGIIDHRILNLHHVRDLPVHVPLYDWLFLAVGGVGFMFLGSPWRGPATCTVRVESKPSGNVAQRISFPYATFEEVVCLRGGT